IPAEDSHFCGNGQFTVIFFLSSRRRHTRFSRDWSSDVCSSDLNFGKNVHDNGWGMFTSFLEYKLKEQGKQLVKIDKWFPSTKKCSCCGKEKEMPLSERVYK